ncbi:hypothetical protein MASR2M78_28460 [Treponema sp.]
MRVLAKDIAEKAAQSSSEIVELRGWVHRVRELGGVSFVMIRDRSGIAQAVVRGRADLSLESVVLASGTLALNNKAPGGAELQVQNLSILASAAKDLPIRLTGIQKRLASM